MASVSFDLFVTGGTLVTSTGVRSANLCVRDGRIAEVLPPHGRADAADTLDASGLHILPGVIDTHVHTRHPGVPEREDFLSGTSAAAAGGITTLFEIPANRSPGAPSCCSQRPSSTTRSTVAPATRTSRRLPGRPRPGRSPSRPFCSRRHRPGSTSSSACGVPTRCGCAT